jgi:hypothetical protein
VDEDIVAIVGFFATVIIVAIGVPLVRAWIRRIDRQPVQSLPAADTNARLERIEQAIDAMSVEVERIAEGQRFVTRLMTDNRERVALPHSDGERHTSGRDA